MDNKQKTTIYFTIDGGENEKFYKKLLCNKTLAVLSDILCLGIHNCNYGVIIELAGEFAVKMRKRTCLNTILCDTETEPLIVLIVRIVNCMTDIKSLCSCCNRLIIGIEGIFLYSLSKTYEGQFITIRQIIHLLDVLGVWILNIRWILGKLLLVISLPIGETITSLYNVLNSRMLSLCIDTNYLTCLYQSP